MTSFNKSLASNAIVLYLGIAVFVALLYGQTLTFSYTGDDTALIKENKIVQQGFSSLSDLFTKSTFYGFNKENFGAYRPLTMLTFATEVAIWGNKPGCSHFVNILLYMISGCLLYRLMTLIFQQQQLVCLIITVLFLAHPVHTEVVANIKSRDEILAFIFSLLLPLTLLWKHEGNKTRIALAYLSFFLGLFAKENAVIFFVPVALTLFFFQGTTVKETLYYTIPFVALVVVYLGIRNVFLESIPASLHSITNTLYHCQTISEKAGTMCYMALAYLKLLLFPVTLSWDHSFSDIPVVSIWKPVALFSFIVHISLLIYAVWNVRKKTLAAYLILFYFSTLFLFLNIVFPLSQNIAERFLLVPSLAFCAALVLLLNEVSQRIIRSKTLLYVVASMLFIFYTVRTIKRNPVWKNNDAFFASAVKDAPQSFHAHQSLGLYLSAKADEADDANRKMALYTEAKESLERSVAIYPGFQTNWYMLGRCAQLTGDLKKAEQAYLKSIHEFEETKIESVYNLAMLYKQMGDTKKAIVYFKKVNALKANFNNTDGLLGEIYLQLNERDQAEIYLTKASYDKKNTIALNNLGVLYYTGQQYTKAETYFKLAVQSDSCFVDGLKNTAASCQVQGKNKEAVFYYENLVQCYPAQQEYYLLLISFLNQIGESAKANEYQSKLNSLKSNP